ncbi:MAG: glycerophosphodiester phosphodiesterase [Deltaproteobacteria bacterium]|nr:glycerophosphodiester phosphodiesterase [Deltaproteobacteria bacterium]
MDPFLKIAHRGYSARYPENTLLAFENAVAAGADVIELDVHLSRDGRLVVIHDDRIDRTADGTGAVSALTLAELKRHNYNNGMSQGFVEIPTLDEVIAWAGDRVMINVEIKNRPIPTAGIEQKLADLLRETRFADQVIVSSFDHCALAEMKRIAGSIRRGMLYDSVWLHFQEEVRALDVYSVHPGADAIDADQLRWAKSRGIRVYPWVIKDAETLKACRDSGLADGAIVNDLALFEQL